MVGFIENHGLLMMVSICSICLVVVARKTAQVRARNYQATRRDLFAGIAMHGLLAHANVKDGEFIRPGDGKAEDGALTGWACIAEDAYDLADAMVDERQWEATGTPGLKHKKDKA